MYIPINIRKMYIRIYTSNVYTYDIVAYGVYIYIYIFTRDFSSFDILLLHITLQTCFEQ